jgi:hypothetical protein
MTVLSGGVRRARAGPGHVYDVGTGLVTTVVDAII